MATEEKDTRQSILSNGDFLKRVEAVRADIQTLTTNVSKIATLHQSVIANPSSPEPEDLKSQIANTQTLNASIRDQIKFLEKDAVRSNGNHVKDTQVRQLKSNFTRQLQDYQREESNYQAQYQEAFKRQYKIVYPEAPDDQVQKAMESADPGDGQGVFQTALLTSDRRGYVQSTLESVRARHYDIQKIERTLLELQQIMEELATTVVLQEEPVQQIEQQTSNVQHDTEAGNTQLSRAIRSAERTRKMKWWCFWICVLIILVLALILGLYFGLRNN